VTNRSCGVKGKITGGQPREFPPPYVITPPYALTKNAIDFIVCVLSTAYAFPDFLLYTEAKAPLAVFEPEVVDGE
jgi:hypothetical protein